MSDRHAYRVLEVPQTLEQIANYAASESGRVRLAALADSATAPQRTLVQECMGLLSKNISLPVAAFQSLREILTSARREGVILSADEFEILRRVLELVERLKTFARRRELHSKAIRSCMDRMDPCDELVAKIDQVFDRKGEIMDRASDRLYEVRRGLRQLSAQINAKLEALLRTPHIQEALQDQYIDLRNGRYVVPVRRELRTRIRGIVHDQSNSGRTLFVEPQALVEMGNDLTGLRVEERDECRKILAELSDLVRANSAALRVNEEALCEYDVACAVSNWSRDFDCCYVPFGKALVMHDARHPLLQAQLREENRMEELVPLDMRLGVDMKVLAVTGSNSGGKTIVLKTIGLLTVLGQLGLPIPVDARTQLRRFEGLHADIGDEQSLQQNLSTFSAHMKNISAMMRATEQGTHLIMLDELCAGTDPLEGGALACGILDELARRDVLVLATTHLGVVKEHVQQDVRMLNSTVLFNRETLKPEYKLILGRPGASHALDVARRFGIPERVIGFSREQTGTDNTQVEDLLSSLQDQDREMRDKLGEIRSQHAKLMKERDELQQELGELKKQRRGLLKEAKQEARNIVDNTRRDMDKMLRQAEQAGNKKQAGELRAKAQEKSKRMAQAVVEVSEKPKVPQQPAVNPQVGDWVRVELLGEEGTLLAIDKGRASVDVDGKRFQVPATQLAVAKKKAKPAAHVTKPPVSRAVSQEIVLVGMRVDEAMPKLEKHLSDIGLSGLAKFHVVHGRGTGRLRDAVHRLLRDCRGVDSFRLAKFGELPGSDGVTIVTMHDQ